MNTKRVIEFGIRRLKNYGDLGGCRRITPSSSSSEDAQPHSIIVKSGTLCFQIELQ